MEIPVIGFDEVIKRLTNTSYSHQNFYIAMYSSWLGGITLNPHLMVIPIDDHMVHRGDGAFEVFKCINGNIYQLDAHFERLKNSLNKLQLTPPYPLEKIKQIVIKTVKVSGEKNCVIRLYISRGPGDFSPNPAKSIGPQLYVVITKLVQLEKRKRTIGCSLKISKVPSKGPFFAAIKSCNYLQNVLMELECSQLGVDYVVNTTEKGKIGEGATENFAIITKDKRFLTPSFDHILKGTTILRAIHFAKQMVDSGLLKEATTCNLYVEDFKKAEEILVFGTTIDVLPITTFEENPVGDGKPGKFYKLFFEKFIEDQTKNKRLLTPVW